MSRINRLAAIFCLLCVETPGARSDEPHSRAMETIFSVSPADCVVSGYAAGLRPRRIVIVTTQDRQDRFKEQDLLADTLAKHLRLGQRFDVVVSRKRICRHELPMQRGAFDEHELLELSRTYHADAVLYCEVEEFSGYQPMQLQFSMLLVHIGEAVTLASATASLDLRRAQTNHEYALFARYECHPCESMYLYSPTLFIDYASAKLAQGVLNIWAR